MRQLRGRVSVKKIKKTKTQPGIIDATTSDDSSDSVKEIKGDKNK